jgi:hypothetical protein
VTSIDEAPDTATAPAVTVPPATRTEDAVMALCGTVLIVGAATDGWAHNNILKQIRQEGFITPWHGILYAGFAASAVWAVAVAYRRRHIVAEWWRDGWPAGYRVGALGLLIFLFAGGADAAWHTAFGIEVNIEALLSPSHLALAVGSVLFLSSPTRSWWAQGCPTGWRAAPGVWALALTTASAAVFFGYASPFYPAAATAHFDKGQPGSHAYAVASLGLAGYVVTTVVLVVPLLLIYRRRAVPGMLTAPVAAVALFAISGREFPATETAGVVAAIIAAALVETVLFGLDRRRGADAALRLPIAGAVTATLLWSAHLLGLQLAAGIAWPLDLWSGTVVVTAAVGALIGGLAARPVPASELART